MAASKLIIVESPSKATTIKKFLGSDYKVMASKGHVRDLPKSKLGVNPEKDFEVEYINIRGKAPLINELKKEAKKAKTVYLATDPDREGEAIAWHLAYLLNLPTDSLCRVTFNEITKDTVKKSIKEPRTIDMNLTDAQQARRVMDRIVGYKISPLLWKKVKRGLSAGRVQSVAVKLIVERENEIEAFIPEEYWNLFVTLEKDGEKFQARLAEINNKKIELHKKEEVDKILADIKEAKFIVSDVKNGTKKRTPAPPFTTSTMQQEASRKLNFAIKKTMQIAQTLYESGYITYMRTDSTRISEEARAMAKTLITNKYGNEYYENRYYRKATGAQDAHEAIRPTNILANFEEIKSKLNDDQFKLYSLIFNRFIASQMAQAIYDTVSATIDARGKDETYNFKASGQTIKFKGFMTLYVEDKDTSSDDDNENNIPKLEIGETLKKKKIEGKQSFTEPPARYTEASLVKALEEKGIGRPSTYATIISTIIERRYIQRQKKQLVPTELGKVVNKLLVENFPDIINVEFTANIENQFDQIAEGKEEWKQVLRDFYGPFEKEVEKVDKELEHVKIQDEVTNIMCNKCGKPMVIKYGRYGKFLACSGYPDCKNIEPFHEKVDVPCPVCGSEVYLRRTNRGRKYYICSKNNKKEENPCNYISWDAPKLGEPWSPEDTKPKSRKRATKKSSTKSSKKTTRKSTTKKTTKKSTTKRKNK